jgi:hypothetical protein
MLTAGVGLVALGKRLARNDVAWLTAVIGRALGVPGIGAQMSPETKLEVAGVPMVLKGVAFFLAASGAMALFAEFAAPKLGGPSRVTLPLGHWNIVYAISILSLSAGVWLRRPWAWWGGFLVLGLSVVSSVFFVNENAQMMPPPFIRIVFEVLSCVVVAVWGRWWYAQRKHFLWTERGAL